MERSLTMKKPIKNRGFITLEASIFLPVFIIGILTIAYLMKFIYAQENLLYSICDEAKLVSKNTYISRIAPLISVRIEDRLEKENVDVAWVQTTKFYYLYRWNGLDGLIRYEAEYWMDIKFPIKLYNGFIGSETVVFRGLIGNRRNGEGTPYEEMEKEQPSSRVWIFPSAGEKFHKRDCSYIIVLPTETILTDAVKKRYHACPICGTKKVDQGSLVYCFYKTGEAYHTGKCPTVDKYVLEIEKDTAVKKGYAPCSKCGGS